MATININRDSTITHYKQITATSCAATCAGMCVNESPQQLKNDGFNLESADWSGIATKYGYKLASNDSANYKTALTLMKDTASGGHACAVTVKVNNSDTEQHWVVINKFNGDDAAPAAANFTCVDPVDGAEKNLKDATNFMNVYKTRA
jgi:hypothetical protein